MIQLNLRATRPPRLRTPLRSAWGFLAASSCLVLIGASQAGVTAIERVSVATDGTQGDGPSAGLADLSDDGRLVVFDSAANSLVAGDSGNTDVFLRDRTTGVTEQISLNADGSDAAGECREPTISGDGRYVAFVSTGNLTPGSNTREQIYLVDLQAQPRVPELVSMNDQGEVGELDCGPPSLSRDGQLIAFPSTSANLVAQDTNNTSDIFVRDRGAGTTRRVSVSSSGEQGIGPFNGGDRDGVISADGSYVVFTSDSANLVAGDNNNFQDAFVHNRTTGETELMSRTNTGVSGNNGSNCYGVSADGRYVLYYSIATNLQAGAAGAVGQSYVRDRVTDTVEIVSKSSTGQLGSSFSFGGDISDNGRFVTFISHATNLVTGDTNGMVDAFVHDRQTGTTERINLTIGGVQANGSVITWGIWMSGDGGSVAFTSWATNLVPSDTNGWDDTFVVDFVIDAANQPPIARAGDDRSLSISHDGTPVTNTVPTALDGSSSSDPENGLLTFEWRNGQGNVVGQTALLNLDLPAGRHLFTLKVTDPQGKFDEDPIQIEVAAEPNQLPIANAGPDQTITTDSPPVKVQLDGSASSDPDGDEIAWGWKDATGQIGIGKRPLVTLPVGRHEITLQVWDVYGGVRSDQVVITVNSSLPEGEFPLEVMAISSKTIELRFKDPSREERQFEIERSDREGGDFRKIGTLPASKGIGKTLKFRDNSARAQGQGPGAAGTPVRNYYRIRAMLQPRGFRFSAVRYCFVVPAPTNLDIGDATTITEVAFPIVWSNPALGEEGIEIEVSEELATSGNSNLRVTLLPRIQGTTLQGTTLNNLVPNRYHRIRVRCYTACGVSDWSERLAFFTPPDFSTLDMRGNLLVDTPSLSFGQVGQGQEAVLPMVLGDQSIPNPFSETLYWKNLPTPFVNRNGDSGNRAGFQTGRATTDTTPNVMSPQTSQRFDVRFRVGSTAAAGSVNGRLIIYTNDSNNRVLVVPLNGTVR